MPQQADWPWQGRSDSSETGDTRRMHHIAAPFVGGTPPHANAPAPVLMGFACDAGVRRNQGRPGAALGPAAIRQALANLAAHGLAQFQDAGDIGCAGDALEAAQQDYADAVTRLLASGARPVLLGGGHEIAWGSFLGLRQHLDQTADAGRLLVLNLDAHLDLRTARPPNSGTPFDQIAQYCAQHDHAWRYACLGVSVPNNTAALFARADALQACVLPDSQLQERHLAQAQQRLDALMRDCEHVYLTIDLDVLPGAVAPGVSAPAALGVPLPVIEALVEQVIQSGKLRLADIAELNPLHDQDHRTAKVAARLAWQLLQGRPAPASADR